MRSIKTLLTTTLFTLTVFSFLTPVTWAQEFVDVLQTSTESIAKNVRGEGSGPGAESNPQLIEYLKRFINLITPIVITVGVAVVLFGAYKMMSTEKEDAIKEGGRLVLYGVIGIVIMVSAQFLGDTLVSKIINNNLDSNVGLQGLQVADSLYEHMLVPFLKIIVYLSSGILFFLMVMRVFTFLTSQDESVKKKATGIIIRSVIGIIIILAANQIVEAVFGKRDQVINPNAQEIGDVGTGIYEVQTIPIIYSVINRVMGLTTLAVLVLIIFQTFQLLTKPDNADNISKIKKTLIYVAIGVGIIGAGYVISNVLILN
jgi:hypothetical protein